MPATWSDTAPLCALAHRRANGETRADNRGEHPAMADPIFHLIANAADYLAAHIDTVTAALRSMIGAIFPPLAAHSAFELRTTYALNPLFVPV